MSSFLLEMVGMSLLPVSQFVRETLTTYHGWRDEILNGKRLDLHSLPEALLKAGLDGQPHGSLRSLFHCLKYPVDQSFCRHLIGRTFVDELEESLVVLTLRLRHH